jgi:DNA-binding IclR family transcriptional regulator
VANGKVLLAYQDELDLGVLLAQPLAVFTDHTVTDPAVLRAELLTVRQRGYAAALGEIEEGLNAVAAPIRDAAGVVVAALSVSGPAYRVMPERVPELGQVTGQMAGEISRRLGYRAAVRRPPGDDLD